MRYIALLRGINVGGHKSILMNDLKIIFEEDGLKNVSTYIQSGNVIFDSPFTNSDALRKKIEQFLFDSLGFEVTTLLRTTDEMKKIVAKNSFVSLYDKAATKMYVVFLEHKPLHDRRRALLETQFEGYSLHINNREIYCLLDAKFRGNKSPFSNTTIEKILGQRATTRNWTTTLALSKLG